MRATVAIMRSRVLTSGRRSATSRLYQTAETGQRGQTAAHLARTRHGAALSIFVSDFGAFSFREVLTLAPHGEAAVCKTAPQWVRLPPACPVRQFTRVRRCARTWRKWLWNGR